MAGLDPAEALDHDPEVEGDDQRDEGLEGDLDPELAVRLGEGFREHRAPRERPATQADPTAAASSTATASATNSRSV